MIYIPKRMTIDGKRRITLPVEAMRHLGVRENSKVVFELDGDRLIIKADRKWEEEASSR